MKWSIIVFAADNCFISEHISPRGGRELIAKSSPTIYIYLQRIQKATEGSSPWTYLIANASIVSNLWRMGRLFSFYTSHVNPVMEKKGEKSILIPSRFPFPLFQFGTSIYSYVVPHSTFSPLLLSILCRLAWTDQRACLQLWHQISIGFRVKRAVYSYLLSCIWGLFYGLWGLPGGKSFMDGVRELRGIWLKRDRWCVPLYGTMVIPWANFGKICQCRKKRLYF